MISALNGKVIGITGSTITLDVNGVGYEVCCSQTCLNKLALGEKAQLVIQTEVREDSIKLYGFLDQLEKRVFNLLTRVKGVGARSASDIVSATDKKDLLQVIAAGDLQRLCGVKGIGKKTAERIIVELRDKVTECIVEQGGQSMASAGAAEPFAEALEALQLLGFSRRDAEKALERTEQELAVSRYQPQEMGQQGIDTALVIKTALKFV